MSFKEYLRSRTPRLYHLLAATYQQTPLYRRQLSKMVARQTQREQGLLHSIFDQDLTVRHGPFQGMHYLNQACGSRILPKVAGCYENRLHPWIEQAIQRGYRQVIDIGCAEGYYAVGMALRLPEANILAYDLNERARELCSELAEANGMGDPIKIQKECTHSELNRVGEKGCLVICDIEGSEDTLLDPDRAPALKHCDLIVESHDCLVPGISEALMERFSATHDIDSVTDAPPRTSDFPILQEIADEDRQFIIDEERPPGMRWLRMTKKL